MTGRGEYAPQHGPAELRPWRTGRGKPSPALRRWVLARDGNRCVECGSTEHLTLDHIVPSVIGGTEWASNLRTMCQSCNSSRHGAWVREHGSAFYPPRRYLPWQAGYVG